MKWNFVDQGTPEPIRTQALWSTQDIATAAGVTASQITGWRESWDTFPAPSYTNQLKRMPLWNEASYKRAIRLIEQHRASKR